jgi:hypothetical protein
MNNSTPLSFCWTIALREDVLQGEVLREQMEELGQEVRDLQQKYQTMLTVHHFPRHFHYRQKNKDSVSSTYVPFLKLFFAFLHQLCYI